MRSRPYALAMLAFLAAGMGPAVAEDETSTVDLEILGGEKIIGTLRPVGTIETFRVAVPRGASLKIASKGTGRAAAVPTFSLTSDGNPLSGADPVMNAKGAKLNGYTTTMTSQLVLDLSGTQGRDGDYGLRFSFAPQTTWSDPGGTLDPAAAAQTSFAASAGTVLGAVLRANFAGGYTSLDGPNGFHVALGAVERISGIALPENGEYALTLTNTGGVAETWRSVVSLKAPKASKRKLDLRDSALLGPFGLANTAVSGVIGAGGGSVQVNVPGDPLNGTGVVIPQGVLPFPSVITIQAAPPFQVGQGLKPGGPPVQFGPSGTVFDPSGSDPGKQATVSIPFDPASFPGGTGSLRVYVLDGGGVPTLVPPPYTFNGNMVSFPAPHFSRFLAFTDATPAPTGRYDLFRFGLTLGGLPGSFSHVQENSVTDVVIDPAGLIAGDQRGFPLDWSRDPVSGIATSGVSLVQSSPTGSFAVGSPSHATLSLSTDGRIDLRRDPSGRAFVGVTPNTIFVPRAASPTPATSVGTWHVCVYETRAAQSAAVAITRVVSSGILTIGSNGTAGPWRSDSIVQVLNLPGGPAQTSRSSATIRNTAVVVEDGATLLTNAMPGLSQLALRAWLDGDILFAHGFGDDGASSAWAILIRASVNADVGLLGTELFESISEQQPDLAPGPVLVVRRDEGMEHLTIGPPGQISIAPSTFNAFGFDAAGDLAISTLSSGAEQVPFVVRRDGSVRVGDGAPSEFGAMTPSADLLFLILLDDDVVISSITAVPLRDDPF